MIDRVSRAGVHTVAWDYHRCRDPGLRLRDPEAPDPARMRSMGIHYGFGCHLAPDVALSRALTEAVQTRLTYISGSRDDFLAPRLHPQSRSRVTGRDLEEITSAPSDGRLDARPSLAAETFEEDVARLLDAVRAVGVKQVVVVDLTRADIGLPVARVVVPGLEGPGGHLPGARAAEDRGGGRRRGWRIMREPAVLSSVFVFLGPSLPVAEARRILDAVYLPPVAMGDIYRLMAREPRVIAISTASSSRRRRSGTRRSCSRSRAGVRVLGASSMGALRAAELAARSAWKGSARSSRHSAAASSRTTTRWRSRTHRRPTATAAVGRDGQPALRPARGARRRARSAAARTIGCWPRQGDLLPRTDLGRLFRWPRHDSAFPPRSSRRCASRLRSAAPGGQARRRHPPARTPARRGRGRGRRGGRARRRPASTSAT